jgi:hypothetical protein
MTRRLAVAVLVLAVAGASLAAARDENKLDVK